MRLHYCLRGEMPIYRISSPSPAARAIFSTDGRFWLVPNARSQLALPGGHECPWVAVSLRTVMTMHPHADREDRKGTGRREEGRAGRSPGGGWGRCQCSPVGSGQAQGNCFLVNSAASSKNTPALDRGH